MQRTTAKTCDIVKELGVSHVIVHDACLQWHECAFAQLSGQTVEMLRCQVCLVLCVVFYCVSCIVFYCIVWCVCVPSETLEVALLQVVCFTAVSLCGFRTRRVTVCLWTRRLAAPASPAPVGVHCRINAVPLHPRGISTQDLRFTFAASCAEVTARDLRRVWAAQSGVPALQAAPHHGV